jgi:hypothetical protein
VIYVIGVAQKCFEKTFQIGKKGTYEDRGGKIYGR